MCLASRALEDTVGGLLGRGGGGEQASGRILDILKFIEDSVLGAI